METNPQQPIIKIDGGAKTGDSITVACYTLHTCPYRKPNIILKGIEGSDKINDVDMNGQWKTTLTRTGVVKAERSDIECSVTHHGGITTRATKSQSAKCVHYSITIEPKLATDIIEGVAKTFTCTVQHSCLKNPPILSWNYENMPVKDGKKQLTGFELATFSTIKFFGEKNDDGKKLICTTNISGQKITASVNLHVQHFTEPPKPVTTVQNKYSTESPKPMTTVQNKYLFTASPKPVTPVQNKYYFTESPKPMTPVQNKSFSLIETDVMTFDMKTTGLYILAPSFAFLLICIFAGVNIYKKCNRSSPANPQESQLERSQRKSCTIKDYEDVYANMENLNIYGNV
ncbi:uncharacterized protein [Paramisgurnus dabryanus]|uniref:uncharacterized protein n=1 Tax=Paramisgurnus dabryanus TaxID=90735 RepID=UPI003CCF08FC